MFLKKLDMREGIALLFPCPAQSFCLEFWLELGLIAPRQQ